MLFITPTLFAIPFPAIDPVLFEFGIFSIRWYALSYIVGIMLGWWLLGKINRRTSPALLSQKAFDDIVIWAVLGILVGGRLGYVFFYNAEHYLSHPQEIIAVWQGGMSFHGGLLGITVSMLLFCKLHKLPFFQLTDRLVCVVPIGLFFGRIANFINGELYGRITSEDLPWGVIFPHDPFTRHPSQLYEAALEGIVLFILLNILASRTQTLAAVGRLSGLFLCGYAAFRSFIEHYREPDPQLGILFGQFTMGQMLSLPMIILGVILIIRSIKNKQPMSND